MCHDQYSFRGASFKMCSHPRPAPAAPMAPAAGQVTKFCGVTSAGRRMDFCDEISACRNIEIVYFFNQPCHQAPFICADGEVCQDNYCSGQCVDKCPYNWQTCVEGACVDQCSYMGCENCKYGKCGY